MITILATMIGAFERAPSLAKLFLFEPRRLRGDTAEVRTTQGYRQFARMAVSLIQRGQTNGGLTSVLKPQAISSALLGAAEGMIRDRLIAAQQNKPLPFSESQTRAVYRALMSGLEPPR